MRQFKLKIRGQANKDEAISKKVVFTEFLVKNRESKIKEFSQYFVSEHIGFPHAAYLK